MTIRAALLPEFEQEMANTRKLLERVPDDNLGWKPHQKSMTLGRLAQHVAELPGWPKETIERDSLDIATPEGFQPVVATSRRQLLEMFDRNAAAGRAAIAGASDEHLLQTWSLLNAGKLVFALPRVAVLRFGVLNHLIHHRGQLTVYLRLNNIPIPGMYGPSADEGSF